MDLEESLSTEAIQSNLLDLAQLFRDGLSLGACSVPSAQPRALRPAERAGMRSMY